jgi:hypothetical protein
VVAVRLRVDYFIDSTVTVLNFVSVGRNPATGAEIQIAAAKTVKLAAGKRFKDAVNV